MSKNKSQLKIGILLSYLNMGLGNLIPVFYTPIMLSLLGKSEYGLYKLSGSVTSYLSLIAMGIGSAVTRYLIKARAEEGQEAEEQMLGLFLVIFRAIACAALVGGVVLSMNLQIWYGDSLTEPELARMRLLVVLMAVSMALNFAMSPYMSIVTAHEKFLFYQCAAIVTTCLVPIINLVMLFLGYASVGMAVSSLLVNYAVRAAYLIYVRRSMGLRARYRGMPTDKLREILGFSFWIFVANVVGQLYNSTDTVMIGAIPALATTGVAIYNIGAVFNNIVFSLTTSVSSLLTPKTNKMVFQGATHTELTDLAIRVGRLQGYVFALAVTGFIAFGRQFLTFYAPEGFGDAYWVAVFMMVPNMIPLVQSVCLSIIVAQNKHRFRSLVYLGIAIANVIGTWFLMQTPLGIIGAALMTGAAMIIGQGFVMNWYYWKRTGLEIGRFWREVCDVYRIPVVMCVITLILSRWIDFYRLPLLAAGILVYSAVYCLFSWRITMNLYEKELVSGFVRPVLRRLRIVKE